MTGPLIQAARPGDIQEIEDLLRESALPIEGVRDRHPNFFVVRDNGTLVGVIGLEQYGADGLLRSLAVRPSHRSRGIGHALYKHLLAEARVLGIRRLVLLTTSADTYFAARGFRRIDRRTIAGDLSRSAEFNGACPATAICMELPL